MVDGYFSQHSKELAIAIDVDPFYGIGVLLHEFSHMNQWVEAKAGQNTLGGQLWRRIDRLEEESKEWYLSTMKLELDAERRAIRLLKRYGIGTKKERAAYIKGAALYVTAHHVMAERKKWFKDDIHLFAEAKQVPHLLPEDLSSDFATPPEGELKKFILTLMKR